MRIFVTTRQSPNFIYSKYIEKFAFKYKLYLPTKEELKAEIETQKAMFYLQQQDNEEKETEEAVKDGEGWLSIEELKEQMGE